MKATPRIVRGLTLPLGSPRAALSGLAAESLGIAASDVREVRVQKVSVDARGSVPTRVYTVEVWLASETPPSPVLPALRRPPRMRTLAPHERPIIVGTGPAGLWAALRFIEAGVAPIILDRGGAMKDRHASVRDLRRHGKLDPESNLCFGAGGAGTYSDGKLYTRKRDPLVRRVYEDLVALGAPASILEDAHPHIGTNRLIKAYTPLEAFLNTHDVEVQYDARVETLLRSNSGRVTGVRLADGTEILGSAVVLATGHSARDLYVTLDDLGVPMARKAFAVGMRCEHPQPLIDAIQYGPHAGHDDLDPAEYFLKAKVGGRGVYSFCMCPGGFVIPTTTELGHLNVNGMSNHRRGSRFANAALVVTVEPGDFYVDRPGDLDHHGALAGVAFQRTLEQRAYEAGGGGYKAPAQRVTDFIARRDGALPSKTSYRPGVTAAPLHALLPRRLSDPIARAIHAFDQRMPGFITDEAQLLGFETTTSSPIRILRETTLESPGFDGLYPCGEGGGWAGGIVSSAIDGIKVAEAVLGACRA
ncbi:MAG: putative FAD-dependent dehydrogenase [Myxococcota bacterium]|jgi:uncharacterized FAD-dependent dehydrogenase